MPLLKLDHSWLETSRKLKTSIPMTHPHFPHYHRDLTHYFYKFYKSLPLILPLNTWAFPPDNKIMKYEMHEKRFLLTATFINNHRHQYLIFNNNTLEAMEA